MRNAQGGIVGEKFDPLQRVGIYVPGGTAPLVSTVLMTVTLAKVPTKELRNALILAWQRALNNKR